MKYSKKLGIAVFTALTVLVLANSLYITPLTISDLDPSTYVIVPIIMLPLFALFIMKEEMTPDVRKKDIIIGAAGFIAFFLLTLYARLIFSYLFLDFRIDLLLLPILFTSLAVLLFGLKNLPKFNLFLVYSLFASPSILIFLSGFNSSFAVANTVLIYSILKVIFPLAVYKAPITITVSGSSLGIGETCVGLGIMIAIIFFLLPLAYLYNGKPRCKAAWIFSGFVLLLLLNFLRMFFIALAWFAYGASNTLLTIHLFAGIILFYITIIVMMLIISKFGLSFPVPKTVRKRAKANPRQLYAYGISAAILVAAACFLLTLNYAGASTVSPSILYNHVKLNLTSSYADSLINMSTSANGFTYDILAYNNGSEVQIGISNASTGRYGQMILILAALGTGFGKIPVNQSATKGAMNFLDNSSQIENMYYLSSPEHQDIVYERLFPYVIANGTSGTIEEYMVMPSGLVNQNLTCPSYYNRAYTSLLSAAAFDFNNASTERKLTGAYCMIQGLIDR